VSLALERKLPASVDLTRCRSSD